MENFPSAVWVKSFSRSAMWIPFFRCEKVRVMSKDCERQDVHSTERRSVSSSSKMEESAFLPQDNQTKIISVSLACMFQRLAGVVVAVKFVAGSALAFESCFNRSHYQQRPIIIDGSNILLLTKRCRA